jgi:nitronate monooxygenase
VEIGSRLQATAEALVDPMTTRAIVDGSGQDTERSRALDVIRGSAWPSRYTARTLGHPYLDRWRGREDDPRAAAAYREDVAAGVIPPLPVWAGEAVDLITDVPGAEGLVGDLADQAERSLRGVLSWEP